MRQNVLQTGSVLIETLWNVKQIFYNNILWDKSSINRNIVECKAFHTFTTVALYPVLIETLWNVKQIFYNNILWDKSVLIETLWNVKPVDTIPPIFPESVLIETLWNVKEYHGTAW